MFFQKKKTKFLFVAFFLFCSCCFVLFCFVLFLFLFSSLLKKKKKAIMKPIPLAFTLLFLFSLRGNAQQFPELSPIHPLADPAAVVISPPARFTVLTPVLIRMELSSSSSSFEDRASLAVLNRKLPVPSFTVSNSSTTLTITTDKIQLTYKKGGEKKKKKKKRKRKKKNLHLLFFLGGIQNGDVVVKSLDSSSAFKQWSGQSNDQTRNLYGGCFFFLFLLLLLLFSSLSEPFSLFPSPPQKKRYCQIFGFGKYSSFELYSS